jgi:hypothetical protein
VPYTIESHTLPEQIPRIAPPLPYADGSDPTGGVARVPPLVQGRPALRNPSVDLRGQKRTNRQNGPGCAFNARIHHSVVALCTNFRAIRPPSTEPC